MKIEQIVEYLTIFRGLPTYQLERRLDLLLLPYLENALNKILGTDDTLFVYPEFPLWPKEEALSLLNKLSHRSIYADYVFFSKKLNNTVFFVELKTDSGSIGQKQFDTYLLNCREGWHRLINDYLIKAIHAAKNRGPWRKYCYGLDYLYKKTPELLGSPSSINLEQFYLKERGIGVSAYLEKLRFEPQSEYCIKLLYLAPNGALQGLRMDNKESSNYFYALVTLSQLANYVEEPLVRVLRIIDK